MKNWWLLFVILAVPAHVWADEPIVFTKTKYLYQEGEKSKNEKVRFRFGDSMLVIHDKKEPEKSEKFKAEIAYSDITELTYERSQHPRTKTAIFLSPLALFSKGKKHWLYLSTSNDAYLFQMDKKEYMEVLMTLKKERGSRWSELSKSDSASSLSAPSRLLPALLIWASLFSGPRR